MGLVCVKSMTFMQLHAISMPRRRKSQVLRRLQEIRRERRASAFLVDKLNHMFGATYREESSSLPVLVETGWWMYPNYVGVAYALDALGARAHGSVVGFEIPPDLRSPRRHGQLRVFRKKSIRQKVRDRVTRRDAVLGSLGVSRFCDLELDVKQMAEAYEIAQAWFARIDSLSDIERLVEEYAVLGDLIYDDYLSVYRKTEIIWDSEDFFLHLLDFSRMYVYFRDLLLSRPFGAVIVSQTVYRNAIPSRVAIAMGIPAFMIDHEVAYRLSADRMLRDLESLDFPGRFQTFTPSFQQFAIEEARRELDARWAGDSMTGLEYMQESAFGAIKPNQILRQSSRPKVLIAPHDFFDSPHCYGLHAFPDFTQWLNFLAQFARTTDYDWYLKTHTLLPEYSQNIIDEYCRANPHITAIPSDTSHRQLLAEGIDVVLTLYGTIAAEYAFKGKLAISASLNNPHSVYSFSLNARDDGQLAHWLSNLEGILSDWKVNLSKVLEYFFMANLERERSWLFGNMNVLHHYLGPEIHKPEFYEVWSQTWTLEDHLDAVDRMQTFMSGSDYKLIRPRY